MEVKIDRFGINGEGIAKLNDGKLVFVEGAMPEEVVEIEITKNFKQYCIGSVKKLLITSKERIAPKCNYFSKCGGCDLQHVTKNTQLEIKKKFVKDTLKKIANIEVADIKVVAGKEFGYRNKMVFPVGSKNNRAFVGMFKRNSNEVVDIDNCLLANDNISKVFSFIKRYIEDNFIGYDFVKGKGDIKYLVMRECNGNILLTFVVNKNCNFSDLNDILCKYIKNYGISVIFSNNSKDILGGEYRHLYGQEFLEFDEKSIKYRLDNRGFLQVNDEIKSLLYDEVLSNINKNDLVIDAYSGAGLLTAIISKKCKQVVGIEINHSACKSARDLIKRNNITNVEYYEGDVKTILCNNKIIGFNTVVLDPPRSGCDGNVLNYILSKKDIQKIIYVSCNPSTLARDLNVLKENFDVKKVTLFEMFPNTKHVETLVCLQRQV